MAHNARVQFMSSEVFISHASEDRAAAETICRALEDAGVRCWIAFRDIPPGAPYGRAILEAVMVSRALVVVLSSHTSESPHVLREVERALHRAKTIVPVRVEDVTPHGDLEYFLSAVQWIDAFPVISQKDLERIASVLRPESPRAPAAPIGAVAERAPASDPTLFEIRMKMIAAGSSNDLRRALHEVGAYLHLHPHDPEALTLRDELEKAMASESQLQTPQAVYSPPHDRPRAGMRRWVMAAAVAAVALATTPFILQRSAAPAPIEGSLVSSDPTPGVEPIAAAAPPASASVERRGPEPAAADAIPDLLPGQPMRLVLEATAACYVTLTIDGDMKLSRTMEPGERETYDIRDGAVLTVGDAAALRFTINGRKSKPLGPTGAIETIRITRSNFKEFIQ